MHTFHFAAWIKMSSYTIHHLSIWYAFTLLFRSQKIQHTCWCFSCNKMNRCSNYICNPPFANPAGRAKALQFKEKRVFFILFLTFSGLWVFVTLYKINLIICCQTERKKRFSRAERRKMCFRDYKMKGIKLLWVHRVFPFFLPSAEQFLRGLHTRTLHEGELCNCLYLAWLWARPRAQECATEKGPGEHW